MLPLENYLHSKFDIDEVYFYEGLTADLLEKLNQRAVFSLDAEDPIVLKHVSYNMILIFHKRAPNRNLIYRFLKALDEDKDKENYRKSNTLFDEEDFFSIIKSKKFVLVTHRILSKETYDPTN